MPPIDLGSLDSQQADGKHGQNERDVEALEEEVEGN